MQSSNGIKNHEQQSKTFSVKIFWIVEVIVFYKSLLKNKTFFLFLQKLSYFEHIQNINSIMTNCKKTIALQQKFVAFVAVIFRHLGAVI